MTPTRRGALLGVLLPFALAILVSLGSWNWWS